MSVTRRQFIATAGAGLLLPACAVPTGSTPARVLRASVSRQQLVPPEYPQTEVWTYDSRVPGPLLRARQGDLLRVVLANALPQATTVHWHGIRLPNAMDGVPHLTQKPVAPGGEFLYAFVLPDAGTYWYHPHERSHEQVARGLYGALIVDEAQPPEVDRDETWVLSDWRLDKGATEVADYDSNRFDLTHGGRIGNTVTVNGRFTPVGGEFAVRSGERIRLRLINAATARIFRLKFDGHSPQVIALDGHPVAPHAMGAGVALGPGMRADLMLDCMGKPGERFVVADTFYPRELRVMELVYRDEAPLRGKPSAAPLTLPPNPLSEPDPARAQRQDIRFEGGAMGGLREAEFEGRRLGIQQLVREHGIAWTVNGVARREHDHRPMLTLKLGSHQLWTLHNDTAWHHPIHIHGIAFRILSRNGKPAPLREWADTALLAPRERVEIAFVADNPGDWMFHCHVLAHQQGGMMASVRIQ
ncbi:MAG: multicopper oxidase family protein [Betaproteobacteria bacterium]|jgi:FtsP/CotA-like multicopper oxidase with cupredoxin domain|nr:multicopper oxidase family protein [Betaproteobacteria bacterium]